jgi:hypothetical protein
MILKDPKDMSDFELHLWTLAGIIAMFAMALFFMARCR